MSFKNQGQAGSDQPPEAQGEYIRRIFNQIGLELGIQLSDHLLLDAALTHRSWSNEMAVSSGHRQCPEANERLEFLGDSVLGLIIAHQLFKRYPDVDEGRLSKSKAHLVSTTILAQHAQALGLGEAIRLGHGEDTSGGRQRESILANAMEAVIGAIFLIAGLDAAEGFVLKRWNVKLEPANANGLDHDPKSVLQEICQQRNGELPVYRLKTMSGPGHNLHFEMEVLIQGRVYGWGEGSSKKQAAQMAAADALQAMKRETPDMKEGVQ